MLYYTSLVLHIIQDYSFVVCSMKCAAARDYWVKSQL